MFNRIISHDTFGVVKVGNDAIGDTKLAIRFRQFPLSSTEKKKKIQGWICLWKLRNFSVTQMLREIKIGEYTLYSLQNCLQIGFRQNFASQIHIIGFAKTRYFFRI